MDSLLLLEFLQHFDKKPHTIRPRKDLFHHFDDEEFRKRFRLTKSTVTKLLEQVGIPAAAQRLKASYFIDICIFYTTITTSACRRLIVYNHNN